MRQAATLLKHAPLIKFVGGPHTHAAKVHPLSSTGKMPAVTGTATSKPIELKSGEVSSRLALSSRYRYKVPSAQEAEQIESGGAELVY